MAISKYGTGDILGPDDDSLKKQAKPDWTEKDQQELEQENTADSKTDGV